MADLSNILRNFQDRFFDSVVSGRLVYNTCWEDPRIDRKLLNIDSGSDIVMLTSAGGNAFNYLLDDPEAIRCVDSNPAQNALLELKKALFRTGMYEKLWDFFGEGHHPRATHIYRHTLAPLLSKRAHLFWNRHINYFSKNANEPSFYFRGTSGKVALMIHNRIRRKGLYGDILRLLDSRSLAEQVWYFGEVEPHLWNTFYRWLINRNATMALLGVPASQRNMIDEDYRGGLPEFIRSSIRQVFTKLPVRDNYFWRVYLTGSYTPDCCPNYLKERHFEILKKRAGRIDHHTCSLSRFLEDHPGSYSHFILLDHQDWMAHTRPDLLNEEWKLILSNACPGARILLRSAGTSHSFLPKFVFDRVDFRDVSNLHQQDRVGTYGSTHLGVVS